MSVVLGFASPSRSLVLEFSPLKALASHTHPTEPLPLEVAAVAPAQHSSWLPLQNPTWLPVCCF